jgi:predicted membrane protein
MYLVFSTVALVEVFVLIASAIAVIFLIVRAIVRAIFVAKDETQRVPSQEEMRHLKRADSRPSG